MRLIATVCFLAPILLADLAMASQSLQEFPGATFVPAEYNDGDSFRVRYTRDGKPEESVVRLYFVDAFESTAAQDSDKRRLLEQAREFGFAQKDRVRTVEFGKRAAARVAQLLSKPFSLHTSFASALGRSRKPRIYGMITTAQGEDLAMILVREGLARVHGVGHERPDGVSGGEYEKILADLALQAAVERRGAWSVTDIGHLVDIRDEQRAADRELEALGKSLGKESLGESVNLNTASQEELEHLPGIGSKLAARIIENRDPPYTSVDGLKRVKGVSLSLIEQLRPRVSVGQAAIHLRSSDETSR
jgi:competence protein ComEA